MKRCLIVMALLCLSLISYSQTQNCDGPLSVTIEGSSTSETLDASGVETNSECNDASGDLSGAIDLTVTGGTPDYTYNWELDGATFGGNTQDLSGLGAGAYTVTITDANNCVMELAFVITEPDPILVTGVETDLDCNSLSGDPTGAISLTVEGGTGAYEYEWSTADGSGLVSDASNQTLLSAGTYSVLVTDANGCSGTAEFVLEEPQAIAIDVTETDLDCNSANGDADGELDITPTGGTAPYTYNWTSSTGGIGLVQGDQDQTGLTAGTYTVVVTDSKDCTAEATYTLEEPTPMEVLAVETDLSCHSLSGDPDGSIELTVTGGTGPYTYGWSNGEQTAIIENLAAGTYTVIIQDSKGCEYEASYALTQPDEVIITGTEVQPGCNSASGDLTGEVQIDVVGGTGTYTYAWTGPNGFEADTEDITGLGSGTYTLVVTDSKGCEDEMTFELTEPEAVTCTLDSPTDNACGTNIGCNGDTAEVTVSAEGGTGVYQYSSDGGATYQTSAVFNLPAGTHTITVIDENDCTSTCEITLTEPEALAGFTCVENDECQVGDGEIEVQASGGCAPYTVTWTTDGSNPLNEVSQEIATDGGSVTFTGAEGGDTYNFTITDANGCIIGG